MNEKSVIDYYDQLYEMFPNISKDNIKRAVNYGWRQYLTNASANAEILIKENDLWCYLGRLQKDSLKHFINYVNRLAIKIRILYKRWKIEWNGYYYFALDNKQYLKYLEQTKKRSGRPKRFIEYGNVKLYKIKEECELREREKRYIFKLPYITDSIGFIYYKKDLKADNAELIITREPLKFKDLEQINKKYTYAKANNN